MSLHFEGAVEVKSKFDAEFRRFSLEKSKFKSYDAFKREVFKSEGKTLKAFPRSLFCYHSQRFSLDKIKV